MSSKWSSDYQDPRWKVKRQRILDRDNHTCKMCGDTDNLQVHHGFYEKDRRAWTYPDHSLWTLCKSCHEKVTYANRDIKRVIGEMHPEKLDDLMLHVRAFENDVGWQNNQGAALPPTDVEDEELVSDLQNANAVLRQTDVEDEELVSDLQDDGLTTNWYSNGQKMCEGYLDDEGVAQGIHTWWHENGQKKSEGHYKDGELDGPYNSWHENGQKEWEVHYKNGELDGLVTRWYENGQKKEEVHYKNGQRDGLRD